MKLQKILLASASCFILSACTSGTGNEMQGHHGHTSQQEDNVGKYLPSDTISPADVPDAALSDVMTVKDGDTISLSPMVVKKKINGKEQIMFGYNGQIPGPLIKAEQGAEFYVNVENKIPLPTTNHWHGIRLDNAFDGMPGISQAEIQPGGSFRYTVKVPDAGLFWYHPHVREDIEQDLGLYGNILVTPKNTAPVPANREEILILDDILLNTFGNIVPYGKDGATYVMMGRFGNQMLLNGETDYSLNVSKGDVVRFYLTNTANARPFRISFENARMKLIASDGGAYQSETAVDSLIIGPAERFTIDVLFETAGRQHILHTGLDGSKKIGTVTVSEEATEVSHKKRFETLAKNPGAILPVTSIQPYLAAEPDQTLRVAFEGMNHGTMTGDDGIEWEDSMPMMNALTNQNTFTWKLVDEKTGKTNMDIHWNYHKGDYVKVRVINDDESMQHPIHFHGQFFLVLSVDGKEEKNRVWKDTFLLRTGETADILIHMTNPGTWMFHCHIAEHLQAGMMGSFTVTN